MAACNEDFKNDVVSIYMKEIKDAPTVEEEKAYLERIENGDTEARNEFIERNLKLVISIAKKYIGRGLEFQDIIQEGNRGLLRALNNFKPELGYKFSTYATWWIHQGIIRSLNNDADEIRKPVYIKELITKMYKKEIKLNHKLNREPTLEEVAKEVGITLEQAAFIKKCRSNISSLDSLITNAKDDRRDCDKNSAYNFIEDITTRPDTTLEDKELSDLMKKFLNKAGLTDREKRVILQRNGFIDNKVKTLEEIGQTEGVTRERIRQIEQKALNKLKNSKYKNIFTDYVNNTYEKQLPKEKKI